MKEYSDFLGNRVVCNCIGCKDKTNIQGWGYVWQDDQWGLHQDFLVSIPGMMVLETKRHVQRLDQLTAEELALYSKLLTTIAHSIKAATRVESLAFVLEEQSSHFHLWFLPIYPWMVAAGVDRLDDYRQLCNMAKEKFQQGQITLEEMEQVNDKIRQIMAESM